VEHRRPHLAPGDLESPHHAIIKPGGIEDCDWRALAPQVEVEAPDDEFAVVAYGEYDRLGGTDRYQVSRNSPVVVLGMGINDGEPRELHGHRRHYGRIDTEDDEAATPGGRTISRRRRGVPGGTSSPQRRLDHEAEGAVGG
jgi:hypothetical protein